MVKVGDILMFDNEVFVVEWIGPRKKGALVSSIVNGNIVQRGFCIDEIEHDKYWLKVEI